MDAQMKRSAVAREMAAAIGRVAGRPAELTSGQTRPSRAWVATLADEGDSVECRVAIDHAGAAAVARLIAPGQDGDEAVAGVLRNVVATATAALAGRPQAERIALRLSALEALPEGTSEPGAPEIWSVGVEGLDAPLAMTVSWSVAEKATVDVPPERSSASRRLDVILDIELPVVVRFGHTEMPIRALSRLSPGSVIELGRSPDDPVEILVSNRVVARGEVVIVGGNYGVRVLDVTSQSERVRSMEV
jgi:flagellar motor switch protein FliN